MKYIASICAVLAVLYWVFESAVHAFIFKEGSFFSNLFIFHSTNEIWMRSFITVSIILFGFYAQVVINRRKKSEEALKMSESRLADAQSIARIGNWEWNIATGDLCWSDEIYTIFGLVPGEFDVTYEAFLTSVHPDDRERVRKAVDASLREHAPYSIDHRIIQPDGTVLIVHEEAKIRLDRAGNPVQMVGTIQDVTARVQAENILRRIEEISAKTGDEYFHSIAEFIALELHKEYAIIGKLDADCHTVHTVSVYAHGKIAGNIEYELQHTPCNNVMGKEACVYPDNIQKRFPKDKLLVDMKAESYAGIPLFASDGSPLGVIAVLGCKPMHEREKETTISTLRIFSSRASSEMERKITEDRINKNYQTQSILNEILHISLEDIPLEQQMQRALDAVLSAPFLQLLPAGAIFLAKDKPDMLVLTAYRNLSAPLQSLCSEVPFGTCLCGLAAGSRRIEFSDRLDSRHTNMYDNMEPHGHYVVPILSRDRTLGVLALYLKEGHRRNPKEEEFLKAVSDTLAGIIERKLSEDDLQQSYRLLDVINRSQSRFIFDSSPADLFNNLLNDFISLTQSEYGFIGEVHYSSPGSPYLKTHAITDISWNEETRAFYKKHAAHGLEFYNLDTLFGEVLKTGDTLISNNPARHPKRGGLPEGHPPLDSFVGIPLYKAGRLVGMVGLANRPSGYTGTLVEYLQPLSATCGTIIEEFRNHALRKKAVEEMEKFKFISDHSNDAHFLIDGNAKFLYVNKAACEKLGYSESELLELRVTDIDIVYNFYKYRELFELSQINPVSPIETINRRKDGSTFPSEISVTSYTLAGKPYLFAALRNISERKRAEQALLESEERFKGIVDNISIGVMLLTPRLEVLLVNRTIKEWFPDIDIFGHPSCRSVFRHFEDNDVCLDCPSTMTLLDGRTHEITTDVVTEDQTKTYRIISSPIKDRNGNIISLIELLEDITEHKKLEEQLLHAQKMESIGTLAGGVAHDFNNIITAIIGFVSVLNRRMRDDDPLKVYINQIQTATEYAANLTSSLLTFSRKQRHNPECVNFNDVIRKMSKFLLRIIGEDIEFRSELMDETLNVRVDYNQMEQVLLNLVGNARDAMPDGGSLTIRTGVVVINHAFIKSHGFGIPGTYASVTITDTGSGLDEKTRDKIFEPFFTTKEVNRGTGLGLSIVYGIIKQHNGYITVDSRPGWGTAFTIYLPLTKQSAASHQHEEEDSPPVMRGTETILVAEDDAMIRDIIESELREFGYTVISTGNGEEAVHKFMENRERIDMVVTDIIMPKKSGREVYNELRGVKDDLKFLFMSGYSDEVMQQNSIGDNAVMISKPVKVEKLLLMIREMLDGKDGSEGLTV